MDNVYNFSTKDYLKSIGIGAGIGGGISGTTHVVWNGLTRNARNSMRDLFGIERDNGNAVTDFVTGAVPGAVIGGLAGAIKEHKYQKNKERLIKELQLRNPESINMR